MTEINILITDRNHFPKMDYTVNVIYQNRNKFNFKELLNYKQVLLCLFAMRNKLVSKRFLET